MASQTIEEPEQAEDLLEDVFPETRCFRFGAEVLAGDVHPDSSHARVSTLSVQADFASVLGSP